MGVCRLCQANRELRESHVIPKFVTRYLKSTSATGYLRGAEDPNLRLQDSKKVKLLCDSCEQLLSGWEREFKNSIFDKIQSSDFGEIEYGPWMLKFVVSISWRVLVVEQTALTAEFPQFENKVNRILETWKAFLLGKISKPVDSQHHVFVLGTPSAMNGKFHPKMLHYLLRGADATSVVSSRHVSVYSKLLRVLIFSPLIPAKPGGWINTRVFAGAGRLVSPQTIRMVGFGEFLNSRVAEGFTKQMSEPQREKIRQTVMKDPRRALTSESFAVHRLSKRILGTD